MDDNETREIVKAVVQRLDILITQNEKIINIFQEEADEIRDEEDLEDHEQTEDVKNGIKPKPIKE